MSRETDKKNRARLRKKLEAQGVAPEVIDQIIARRRADHLAKREWLREQSGNPNTVYLNDAGYRPIATDPLLTGQARATGQAAKAVKRGRTITAYEYGQDR